MVELKNPYSWVLYIVLYAGKKMDRMIQEGVVDFWEPKTLRSYCSYFSFLLLARKRYIQQKNLLELILKRVKFYIEWAFNTWNSLQWVPRKSKSKISHLVSCLHFPIFHTTHLRNRSIPVENSLDISCRE